jgi:sugar phosphate isomerase/epimerase
MTPLSTDASLTHATATAPLGVSAGSSLRSLPLAVSRRGLLTGLAAAAATTALWPTIAAEPIAHSLSPRFQLGLAAYSFRRFFPWMKGKPQQPVDENRSLTIQTFLNYAADLRCSGAELTAYFFDPATTNADLLELKRQAFTSGIAISGTAVGNRFTRPAGPELDEEIADVKRWIDRTALLGSTHLRVFAGTPTKDLSEDEAFRQCAASLEICCDYAATKGVVLGLENHGGIVATADGLLKLMQAVKSPWLGVNLDTGNFRTADPYADLARCAPSAVNVQYKVEIQRSPNGPKEPADLKRVVEILTDVGYRGFLTLEYEAAEDPFDAVPKHLDELREACGSLLV